MGTYERLARLIGRDLMRMVERQFGGQQIRIRKYVPGADLSQFADKPISVSVLARIIGKSRRHAARIRKKLDDLTK